MLKTLEILTEGKGEDISFGWLARKPAGRSFRGVAYWATTMWPENASDYHAYMLGFITEHGSAPWQIIVVDQETEEISLIKNRGTGELISLDEWLHLKKRTSLYTAEEALAERYDHFEKEQRN